MKRVAVAIAAGFLVAVVFAPAFYPALNVHPDVCSSATNVGDFCAKWDPQAHAYVGWPSGVPADGLSRNAEALSSDDRPLVAIGLLAAFATWLALAGWSGMRARPDDGPDPLATESAGP